MIKRILYKQKASLFLLFMLMLANTSGAQDSTYIKKEIPRSALYSIRVNSGIISGGNYDIEGTDALIGGGSTSSAYVTDVEFSVPVFMLKSGTVSLGAYYNYMHQQFEPRYLAENAEPVRFNNNHHVWGAKLSYNFRTSLCNKPLFGFTNVRMECSQYGLERISGFAAAALLVKQTERSSLSVGALILVNSITKWPLYPFIIYRHKFNDKWFLNIMMPQCNIGYNISEKNKLLFGATVGSERYYIRPCHGDLPSTCMYSRSYVRPEITFEHYFTPLMRCSLRCGSMVYINGKFNSEKGNSRYGEVEHDAATFLQLSFSYGLKHF